MPDLDDLDRLLALWRKHITNNPERDLFSRGAGYIAGLEICAAQLAETLERIRADA